MFFFYSNYKPLARYAVILGVKTRFCFISLILTIIVVVVVVVVVENDKNKVTAD